MGCRGGAGNCLWRDTCAGRLVGEMGLSAFPALSGAGGCADGVCVGWLAARSFGVRRFTDALPGGVSPLSFDGRRNGGALWTAVSDL